MNWFYILLRTFPFWGIPIGAVLIISGFTEKKKFLILIGIGMIVGGAAFLAVQGHFKAVPWAHEVLFQK